MNSTGDAPGALQMILQTQRASAHAAGGPGMVPSPLLDLESVPVQIIVFFFNIGDPLTRYVNAIEFVSLKAFI